jgi:hypothetical protein
VRCAGEVHLKRVHGVDAEVLLGLKDAFYEAYPNRHFEKFPWSFLEYFASLTDQSTCLALRELLSNYPQAYERRSRTEKEQIRSLLDRSLDEILDEVRAEQEAVDKKLSDARSQKEQEIREFLQNLDLFTSNRFGMAGDDVFLLILRHPEFFSSRFWYYSDIHIYLFQHLTSPSTGFDKAILRASAVREKKVAEGPLSGWHSSVIRVFYTVFGATNEPLAKRMLDTACRRGTSNLFADVDTPGGDFPTLRRLFLDSIVGDHNEFRRYFMSLWESQSCQSSFPEFNKKSGDSWEKSMRY